MKWQFIRDETCNEALIKGRVCSLQRKTWAFNRAGRNVRMMQNSHSGPFNLIDVGNE